VSSDSKHNSKILVTTARFKVSNATINWWQHNSSMWAMAKIVVTVTTTAKHYNI